MDRYFLGRSWVGRPSTRSDHSADGAGGDDAAPCLLRRRHFFNWIWALVRDLLMGMASRYRRKAPLFCRFTGRLRHQLLLVETFVILAVTGRVELEVFAHGFLRDASNLFRRESLAMQGGDLDEVGQVASTAGLGVVGLALDVAEGIVLEVEVEDDRIVRLPRPHVVLAAASKDEQALAAQMGPRPD